MRLWIPTALAAVTLSACSLLVDMRGLSRGNEDDKQEERDASAPKGPSDDSGPLVVVPPSNDARVEDGPAANTGKGCAGSTDLLCTDFDRGSFGDGWQNRLAKGALDLTTESFHSPPSSLRASTQQGTGVAEARLAHALDSLTPKRAIVSMQVLLCQAHDEGFELLKLQELTGGGGVKLFHNANSAAIEANLRDRPQTYRDFAALPIGRWTHVVLDVRYDVAAGAMTVTVDDTRAIELTNIATFSDPLSGFYVGLWTAQSAAPCTAHFDDIRVSFEL